MTYLYRLFSLVINFVAVLLTVSLLFTLPVLLFSPQGWLNGFMIISFILYTWFALRFRKQVLQRQESVSHTLRDWTRVNGFVTIFFAVLMIMRTLFFIQNTEAMAELKQVLAESMKKMSGTAQSSDISVVLYFLLIYGVILLVHILWTFALMKKNEKYFV